MELTQIRDLVADDMHAVNECIINRLQSSVVLINQLGSYIVHSGGKRLRPLLLLLSAKACQYQGHDHIPLATIIEFIHTATLLHDDVVDASEMRRGRETANAIFGNEASVLVGDFLYSRAFEMMVELGSLPAMQIVANATKTIAEGEVLQLLNCHDADTTEASYMDVIQYKTAKLFEAASRLGAVLAQRPKEVEQAMLAYGLHLGTAFQLIDDVLDYNSSSEEMGKNVGDDLAEGKPTLPLIHAMMHANAPDAAIVRHAIVEGGREHAAEVLEVLRRNGSFEYTREVAVREANLAVASLAVLPETPASQALAALAHFSVQRHY